MNREVSMRTILESIESEFRRYQRLGDKAIAQVEAEALTRRPPGEGNSVATLVWHVSGNLRSRFTDFLTTDGEKAVARPRVGVRRPRGDAGRGAREMGGGLAASWPRPSPASATRTCRGR